MLKVYSVGITSWKLVDIGTVNEIFLPAGLQQICTQLKSLFNSNMIPPGRETNTWLVSKYDITKYQYG